MVPSASGQRANGHQKNENNKKVIKLNQTQTVLAQDPPFQCPTPKSPEGQKPCLGSEDHHKASGWVLDAGGNDCRLGSAHHLSLLQGQHP